MRPALLPEMKAGPDESAGPMPLRRATAEDLPALIRIERSAYRHPWSDAELKRELVRPFSRVWVAEGRGSVPVAFGVYWRVADEAQLADLAVDPAWRGAGIGGRLLRRVMLEASREGLATMTLEVGETNTGAMLLYRHAGFRTTGRRPGYYENGEAAVLMDRSLTVPVGPGTGLGTPSDGFPPLAFGSRIAHPGECRAVP